MKKLFVSVWHFLIDIRLSIKRFFYTFGGGSGLSFETKPGMLCIDIAHDNDRKVLRLANEKLGLAVKYMESQPYGSAVVFKERDHWIMVPDYLSRALYRQVKIAHDALMRSGVKIDHGVVGAVPKTNAAVPKTVN